MSGRWNNSAGTLGRSFVPAVIGMHQESDGHALHAPVLVLNASYEPINVCAARRAIVLVLKGVAMTEEENGHFLHAARLALRVPSVIRLLEYRRIPHQTRALSRKNILLRDRNTCQYCRGGSAFERADTRPRDAPSRAAALPPGKTWWPAAIPAIASKATSSWAKPGMKLLREPRAFNLHTSRHIMRLIGRSDDKWRKYLFY